MTDFSKLVRNAKAFFEEETARLTRFREWLDSMRVARALRRRAKERR